MTVYESIQNMSIDDMALMFHTIIEATEQKWINRLISAKISFDKFDLSEPIQIEMYKKYLESEVED